MLAAPEREAERNELIARRKAEREHAYEAKIRTDADMASALDMLGGTKV